MLGAMSGREDRPADGVPKHVLVERADARGEEIPRVENGVTVDFVQRSVILAATGTSDYVDLPVAKAPRIGRVVALVNLNLLDRFHRWKEIEATVPTCVHRQRPVVCILRAVDPAAVHRHKRVAFLTDAHPQSRLLRANARSQAKQLREIASV